MHKYVLFALAVLPSASQAQDFEYFAHNRPYQRVEKIILTDDGIYAGIQDGISFEVRELRTNEVVAHHHFLPHYPFHPATSKLGVFQLSSTSYGDSGLPNYYYCPVNPVQPAVYTTNKYPPFQYPDYPLWHDSHLLTLSNDEIYCANRDSIHRLNADLRSVKSWPIKDADILFGKDKDILAVATEKV